MVRFVYFVAADQEFEQALFDAIRMQAFTMQAYWYEQFDGTFYLYDDIVAVIYGDHASRWYVDTADGVHGNNARWYRLGNIKNEVYRKLDIQNYDATVRVINYPMVRYDGRVGANFGGAWMDGDDARCLLGENSGYNFPYDDGNPAQCTGHVAHEFGHVFGLDHTGPNSDCMQFGFYIGSSPTNPCIFSTDNRNIVKNNASNQSFLEALPGQVVLPDNQVSTR